MRLSNLEINVLDSDKGSYKIKVVEHIDHGDILISLPEDVDWKQVNPEIRKILNLDLRYDNPLTFNKDVRIVPVEPYAKRSVNNYTISPDLPLGLEIDPDTGVIEGTPIVGSLEKTYDITASFSGILIHFYCNISVVKPRPKDLSYPHPSYFELAKELHLTPIVLGDVDYFKIDKDLPEGLSLNETTGEIKGKPLSKLDKGKYTITAHNDFGEDTYDLDLCIKDTVPRFSLQENRIQLLDGTFLRVKPNISNNNIIKFEIAPSIPNGLDFDTKTGALSGVYLKQKDAKMYLEGSKYTLTAYNIDGEIFLENIFLEEEDSENSLDHELLACFMNKVLIKEVYPKKHSNKSYNFVYISEGEEWDVRIASKDSISIEDIKYEMEWLKFLDSNKLPTTQVIKIIPLEDNYIATTFKHTKEYPLNMDEESYYQEVGEIIRDIHEVSKTYRSHFTKENFFNIKLENDNVRKVHTNLKEYFEGLPKTPEEYGMIHGNFDVNTSCRIDGSNKAILGNFSECSLGWYIQDIISFYKSLEDNNISTLVKKKIMDSFLRGYYGTTDTATNYSWIKSYELFNTLDLLKNYTNNPADDLLNKLNTSGYMHE